MDKKSILILAVCFLLLISWPVLINKIWPHKPVTRATTNDPAAARISINPLPASVSSGVSGAGSTTLVVNSNVPEQLIEITNALAHYTFSSYGGGLKLVELPQYPESVSKRR